ncbi:hypothetical protein HHI36_012923 [Cryptolaemus montrouzieri]|uniref:Solute carrier family 46 member 3 n=1 Tax=Cryptolaemus montrouzieri TaxID=559131 RepID=A0ABD2NGP2_9CUCU
MSLTSIPKALEAEFVTHNSERTLFQKVLYMATHITVEPLVFLAVLPSTMNELTTQNMNLEKACRVNIRYNDSVCDALASRNKTGYEPYQEQEVQKLVSNMLAIKMAVLGSYPAFLMLFLGSWSDRHGRRKPLILMPVIGEFIASILLFFCSYFFMETSVEYSMLSQTIPLALGGTWACGFLGLYTYVSGLCSNEDRTIRIGTVTMFQISSGTLGIFLSGMMLNLVGLKGVYLISATSLLVALTYGIFMIKEKFIVENKPEGGLKDFFSLVHIKNTFKVCFKQGSDNRRSKILVIMLLSTMIMGPLHGEIAVVYMYTRIKCGWNEIDYSIYNSLHSIIQVFGSIFALSVFSKYFKLEDAMLGMIAMISKICACFIFAFATSGSIFYVGAFVEIFHSTCHIALRSLMTRIVPTHELGQANSVFGIFEAFTPLIFGPFYMKLYTSTITIFPGAFYIVTSGLYMITFYLFFWMYRTYKNEEKMKMKLEKQTEQEDKLLKVKPDSAQKKSLEKISI